MRIEDFIDLEELLTDEQKARLSEKLADKIIEAIDLIDAKQLAELMDREMKDFIHYNVMEDVDLTPMQIKISEFMAEIAEKVIGGMKNGV